MLHSGRRFADSLIHAPADFAEYFVWPPSPERNHFLRYLQVVQKAKEISATVYTGTLGLAGKRAFTAYDTFAKEKTKEVSTVPPQCAAMEPP